MIGLPKNGDYVQPGEFMCKSPFMCKATMTRKRRYLISAAVLVACVGIALGVLVILSPQPGGTKAKFERIEKGMTEAELDAIFGGPGWPGPINMISWGGNDGFVSVTFDVNGRADSMQWFPSTETISDKLRRWLRLPKTDEPNLGSGVNN